MMGRMITVTLWAVALIVVALLLQMATDLATAATTPATEAAFEAAAADVGAAFVALAPVAVALMVGALALGLVVVALNHVETGAYPITTVGVRKRVTREPVRADESCATCDAPETVERARAAKAVVVGGAVLAEYGAVENYACERHAHRETLEAGADQTPGDGEPDANTEPDAAPAESQVATDGGTETALDAATAEIDDINTMNGAMNTTVELLFLAPLILVAVVIVTLTDLLGTEI